MVVEVTMQRKRIMIILIVLVIATGMLFAEIPSIFEAGLVSTYTIQDLADTQFANYTPAVRAAFYITEWFGLSGEIMLLQPFNSPASTFTSYLATDLVFRWPLGFFEPYLALGPAYAIVYTGGSLSLPEQIPYRARVGFDFNVMPVLAIGIEAAHLIPNIPDLVGSSATGFDFMNNTHVGLVIKAKL
jgi:hypothetical protein